MAPSRPCMSGLPGRMAIRQKPSSMPAATSAFCTRSWSPTDAPPSVTKTSAFASRARPIAGSSAAIVSTAMPRSIGTPPQAPTTPATAKLFEAMICAGPSVSAGRDQFVAGRKDRNPRAPPDRQLGMVARGGQRDVARGETASRGDQRLAVTKVESGGAQIVAGRRGGR